MGDRSNSVFYAKNLKRPLHFQNNLPAQDPLVRDLMTDIKGFSSVGGNNAPARDTNIQTEKSQFDPHGENEDSPADRPEHETVMTVVSQGMNIGVAVYDRYKRVISVAQFLDYTPVAVHNQQGTHEGSFSTLQTVKLQVRPTCIVVSSKADHQLLEACKRNPLQMEIDSGADLHNIWQQHNRTVSEDCNIVVRVERAAAFHYHQAVRSLDALNIEGISFPSSRHERLHKLNTLLDLSKELQISALGALIQFMLKEHVQPHDSFGTQNMQAVSEIHQQDRDVGLTVQSVSELPLSGCLMVDPFTLRSLQIFVNEQHPSNMGIGKPKEGFSLYGMLHAQCMSNMGKRLLRSWMLCPVVNLASVADRQNAVQLFMNSPDKALILKNVVKKIQDIPRVLQRLSDAQVHPDVQSLQTVVFSLQQLQNLRDIFQQLTSAAPSSSMDMTPLPVRNGILPLGDLEWSDVSISHKIMTQISSALRQCEEIICDIIDFPQEEGFMIKYGVCEELDKLKDMYHSLPDTLTMVLQEELHRIPQHLAQRNSSQLWSIVYLPQIGYVMQISGAALTDDLADILKDYEHVMEGQADDGAPSVYFHTQSTRDLSASVGDVLYKIQDLEATLCTELIKRLLLYTPQLLSAASAVAELDCLLAFASCARDGSYCRPKLVPESVLVIDEGRHPLAELVVDTYIPNSTCMDDEGGNRVHIITGPNASGKSCYIKQVAMIAYMAHLGCFVPAKSATIGLIDRIFTRLVSQETIKLHQSTFMIDLTQIAGMIYRTTERSLIIVDEFGKGTLPCDGAGLLSAFVQHICDAPRRPPRALFSTHFQELLDPQVLPKHRQLSFFTMDVVTSSEPESTRTGDTDAVFLYHLVPGHETPSFGIHCAKVSGIPGQVLDRAKEVLHSQETGSPLRVPSTLGIKVHDKVCLQNVEALLKMDLSTATMESICKFLEELAYDPAH